jgi:hypothetical protein
MALILVTIVALMPGGIRAAPGTAIVDKPDPISGEWKGLFEVGGYSAEFTLKLKLTGTTVTGTAESGHTGPGTLSKGSWSDNKLSITMDFAAHESIAVTGTLKDGKLVGEFSTEGMQGTWAATKR